MLATAATRRRPANRWRALTLPQTAVTAGRADAAGAFVPPGAPLAGASRPPVRPARVFAAPAFCRVTATLTPTSDSDIKIEVWLPLAPRHGTGKFQAVGNGGWTGSIPYAAMAAAVAAGYATAGTDTGHVGNTASFALGHPEKVIDFGYRAVHEMTVQAKAVDRCLLRHAADALDLERLLAGRAAGRGRGGPLSGGLRRDHRRCAGRELDAPACRPHGHEPRRERDAGRRDSAGQVRADPPAPCSPPATRATAWPTA